MAKIPVMIGGVPFGFVESTGLGYYRVGDVTFEDASVLTKTLDGKRYKAAFASKRRSKADKVAANIRKKGGASARVVPYCGWFYGRVFSPTRKETCYVVYAR